MTRLDSAWRGKSGKKTTRQGPDLARRRFTAQQTRSEQRTAMAQAHAIKLGVQCCELPVRSILPRTSARRRPNRWPHARGVASMPLVTASFPAEDGHSFLNMREYSLPASFACWSATPGQRRLALVVVVLMPRRDVDVLQCIC